MEASAKGKEEDKQDQLPVINMAIAAFEQLGEMHLRVVLHTIRQDLDEKVEYIRPDNTASEQDRMRMYDKAMHEEAKLFQKIANNAARWVYSQEVDLVLFYWWIQFLRYPVPKWLLFLDKCGEWCLTACVVVSSSFRFTEWFYYGSQKSTKKERAEHRATEAKEGKERTL